ncbi:glucosamine-6-phosphate deaminase [Curtobacterium flaccumfaciens]|uniref:glucosamine-6-phosphate deaminase n=1 Tax=Curtobacterium flaccumfaciens TaxID=2035 RepID=UPI000FFEAC32|nr:glucosamine-6-phosphate deaminase [Curtobacterium flaccumfaciens]MCS0647400.1 glucosamine-6-phosphate deaminase [Curtobacterium flaccumfaciens pv. flaccumfaciens]MCS6524995.1 glucosamine-6-phosphate deaminase [Curtobacterium flaccumfaciens pv. flaccumfaciens]MCS6530141.1 glucosamine-6-phosphate deaminase [Curtobacterium flaccumfaciens pv. flaccumfaciens]NUU10087.1 glucosamine-6-phosphate deaminase [Curtobacterium flaccumfaciens]RXF85033.1 glucosamine-6-phosphate deaminase [Curtobacterium fl
MEIIILPTPDEVGRVAAAKIASVVAKKPSAVIGLATGSSPQGIYTDLQRRVQTGEISFAEARGFALDEYVGIPLEHPESYAAVIARDVVAPLGFDASRVRVPDGRAADLEFAAKEYDAAIRAAGGIDVQILGIGANGHIGFNEPTSSFASRTRIKTLAPSTRDANARFFDSPEQVPTHCMTQGLGTILEARELVLVAQGPSKAAAVAAAIEGPLSSFVPGSALQLHEHATVVVDEEAAAGLQLADYYRYTYANKPAWQRFE